MGLRMTIDIFSGSPNPTWEIRDPNLTREFLELFVRNRAALADPYSGFTGLGFRGVRVERTDDTGFVGLPPTFELAGGGAQDPFAGAELAERLLETMPSGAADDVETTGYLDDIRDAVREEIRRTVREGIGDATSFQPPAHQADAAPAAEVATQLLALARRTVTCPVDVTSFNPAFWNHPSVQPYNNCYNYGTNIRTDTSAVPGRMHGYVLPSTTTGAEVAQGLVADGLKVWGDCQPPGINRVVLALVTGTFPTGFRDFHFFRFDSDGYWTHKVAGNMARHTDNMGIPIINPYLCNRAPYDEWGGLFQSHNSVRIR